MIKQIACTDLTQQHILQTNRLRRKLDEGFDKPCLETVRGMGYRLTAS